jgi:hypothetical protein
MGILICKINGVEVQAPEQWQGVQSLMTWDNENVQANITTTNFTFVADAAAAIKTHFDNGGAFTGLPITFEDVEDDGSTFVFDGYVDFTDGYEDLTPNDDNGQAFKVKCTIKEKNQIDTFKAKAAATTWALLKERQFITDAMFSKMTYVVQKPYDPFEVLMVSLMIAQTAIDVINLTFDIADAAVNTTAHTIGGISGPAAGAAYGVYIVFSLALRAAAIIVKLVQLFNTLQSIFFPFPKLAKVLSFRQYFEIACSGLGGYTFVSSIADLDEMHIFPSKDKVLKNKSGSPFSEVTGLAVTDNGFFNVKDYGYLVGEFFQAIEKLYQAKFKVVGTTVYFEPLLNDGFWKTKASYQAPDVFISKNKPNTDELAATRVISFETDDLDSWTKENYSATAHEIHTELVSEPGDKTMILLKGYDEISVNWALGNQKETKNYIELFVNGIKNLINDMANLVGYGTTQNFVTPTHFSKNLRISQDITKLPKIVRLVPRPDGGIGANKMMKENQRLTCSAKYFYDNYIIEKSFVANSFRGQWLIYEGVRIPFSRSSFVALANNNYFQDMNGDECRMDKIEWEHGSDTAVSTYRIRRPYCTNLQERIINID